MDTRHNSEAQRTRRLNGWKRFREATGKPELSEHLRKLAKGRNERYRAKVRAAQKQEQKAA